MKLLTAPNVLMLGVVAIGGFAAYKLISNKRNEPRPEGERPEQINPTDVVMLGDPLAFQEGRYYRARMRLSALPPFSTSTSDSDIAQALSMLGFDDIRIFSLNELPSDWPKSTTQNASTAVRFMQARWGAPSVQVPRPPNLEAVWQTRPPQGAVVSGTAGMRRVLRDPREFARRARDARANSRRPVPVG